MPQFAGRDQRIDCSVLKYVAIRGCRYSSLYATTRGYTVDRDIFYVCNYEAGRGVLIRDFAAECRGRNRFSQDISLDLQLIIIRSLKSVTRTRRDRGCLIISIPLDGLDICLRSRHDIIRRVNHVQ
jgi:hypothetical protein